MPKLSCIIPAYNEASRIPSVLRAVCGHPLVSEVVVVDDGSSDGTKEAVNSFPGVRLIIQEKNLGKSQAIADGIRASGGELLLFLDADLTHLSALDVTRLIEPVAKGLSHVSISLRANAPLLWRLVGLDYISGERVLPRSLVAERLEEISTLPAFGLEVFLNRLIVRERLSVAVVEWERAESPYKYKKYGFFGGIASDIKMLRDMSRVVSPFAMVAQISAMLKLKTTKHA